jgi:hypothetical protein
VPTDRELEMAWAAGFFDGEGSIHLHKYPNNSHDHIMISIKQTAIEPLERFQTAVGCGKIYGPKNPVVGVGRRSGIVVVGIKPFWRYSEQKHNRDILVKLWPYLSRPKKLQTQRVLKSCR